MEGPILVLTVRNPQMLWLQKEIWLSRKQSCFPHKLWPQRFSEDLRYFYNNALIELIAKNTQQSWQMNVNDAKLQNYGPQISGWLHEQVHYSVHCYNMKNNWHKLHRKISSIVGLISANDETAYKLPTKAKETIEAVRKHTLHTQWGRRLLVFTCQLTSPGPRVSPIRWGQPNRGFTSRGS